MNQMFVKRDMGSASCQSGKALKFGYDLIGDIYGHAGELMSLLSSLGYGKSNGHHAHPGGRRVVFLGDYIDRGTRIREVLQIVRGMVEGGSAYAILGNHEVNALRFHTLGSSGQPLRPHTDAKIRQHRATLDQFADNEEWLEWMRWLAELPLFLERDGLRAVHASWDDAAITALGAGQISGSAKGARYTSLGPRPGYRIVRASRAVGPAYLGTDGIWTDGIADMPGLQP
jgi:hypothetical protein